jgi:hypothetical protein
MCSNKPETLAREVKNHLSLLGSTYPCADSPATFGAYACHRLLVQLRADMTGTT